MLSKSSLADDLMAMFSDVAPDGSARAKAEQMAQAFFKYAMSGKPMCMVMTQPGLPGTISGTGIGGVDKPTPGTGLNVAKLRSGILATYQISTDARGSADRLASAVHSYFTEAIIQTKDKNGGPPAITGIGGVGKSSPGMTYAAAKPILANALYQVFFDVSPGPSAADKVTLIADALHAFFKEGMVNTIGTFSAPDDGNGGFLAGFGYSQGSFT
jgi:hypothetical protein